MWWHVQEMLRISADVQLHNTKLQTKEMLIQKVLAIHYTEIDTSQTVVMYIQVLGSEVRWMLMIDGLWIITASM